MEKYDRATLEAMDYRTLKATLSKARDHVVYNCSHRESIIRAILACQTMYDDGIYGSVLREFDCRRCGERVTITDWRDKRTVFCCEQCQREYWRHRDRYERNKDISRGHVIHTWQLKERDEYAMD